MITAHKQAAQRARTINHLIWTRTVTDDVAEIRDRVVWRRRRQTRFERVEVRVNVAKEKEAHDRRYQFLIIRLDGGNEEVEAAELLVGRDFR